MKLDRTLARPFCEFAYADAGGDGRAVVLVHGAGMDHTMFDDQVEVLVRAGYRPIPLDLRGHGASALAGGCRFSADAALVDLAALVDELRLDAPVLVGHSLGGNLAQEFVRRWPERVGGLVVLDSTWNAGPLSGLERVGLRAAGPMLALIPARSLPGLMAGASAVSPAAVAQIETAFRRMGKRAFLDVWGATASLVNPDPSYRCPVPLALVCGALDRTGNIATAMARWATAEDVVERVIPDAGHVVTLDAPEATSAVLLEILAGWGGQPR